MYYKNEIVQFTAVYLLSITTSKLKRKPWLELLIMCDFIKHTRT